MTGAKQSSPTGGNRQGAQHFVAESPNVTATEPAEQPHPIARALELARCTSQTFALTDPVNLGFLMERWNVRAGCGLDARTLDLVVALAIHGGRDTAPITKAEALDLATSAVHDFETLDDARLNVQRYLVIRGADAGQRSKIDMLVRDHWHARHTAEVSRAA